MCTHNSSLVLQNTTLTTLLFFNKNLQISRIMVSKGFHVPKIFICTCISILISIILFIILLWLVIHPKTPHFTLLQAQIYQLNLSNPNHLLSSSIEITIESKNPNTKVGACYDELHTYASYKSQPITDHATILPFFQGQQESNIFTISLGASGLPVAPTFGFDFGRDMVMLINNTFDL